MKAGASGCLDTDWRCLEGGACRLALIFAQHAGKSLEGVSNRAPLKQLDWFLEELEYFM